MERRFKNKFGKKNHHEGILRWLKSRKYLVILFFAISAILLLSQLYSATKPVVNEVIAAVRDTTLKNISRPAIGAKQIVADSLFYAPYYFFFDSTQQHYAPNEIVDVITLQNQELSLVASMAPQACQSRKFVLVNRPLVGGGILHQVIPVPEGLFTLKAELNFRGRPFHSQGAALGDSTSAADSDASAAEVEAVDPCFIGDEEGFYEVPSGVNPTISIKINNNSDKNILIHSIECAVKRSSFNPYPILGAEPGMGFDMSLKNYGWRPATNLDIHFNIQRVNEVVDYKAAFKYRLHEQVLPIRGDLEFEDSYPDALAPFFKLEHLDVDKIRLDNQGKPNIRMTDAAYGRYKERAARIVGVVYYDGILAGKRKYRDTLYFNFIANLQVDGMGGGTNVEYEAPYNIPLSVTGRNYSRHYAVTESVAPHSSASFDLKFFSGKNAYHYFDIILHYNGDKTLRLENIFLNEYLTHYDSTYYKGIREEKSAR